jgi:hypothetical protein
VFPLASFTVNPLNVGLVKPPGGTSDGGNVAPKTLLKPKIKTPVKIARKLETKAFLKYETLSLFFIGIGSYENF